MSLNANFNNIRRKWKLGAQRQLYNWQATQPLQDGTTPMATEVSTTQPWALAPTQGQTKQNKTRQH